MALDKDAAKKVLAHIDRDELAQLGCDFTSIPSPTCQEKAVAEFILNWFERNGMKAVRQDVEFDRPNAVGIVKGAGNGLSLGFNGHLSPDIVLNTNPVGSQIYKISDIQDVRKKQHLEYIMSKNGLGVETIEKTIAQGSESSKRVALALENKLDMKELTTAEKKAVETFRVVYKHTLDMFVKSRIPDVSKEAIVRVIAKKVRYRVNENSEEVSALLKSYKDRYQLTRRDMGGSRTPAYGSEVLYASRLR